VTYIDIFGNLDSTHLEDFSGSDLDAVYNKGFGVVTGRDDRGMKEKNRAARRKWNIM